MPPAPLRLRGAAKRRDASTWRADELYKPEASKLVPAKIKAVPYCVWDNRAPGEMIVWIREC